MLQSTDAEPVEEFDAGGSLRRIRRLADASQREFAAVLGVSKSLIAAIESGRCGIDALLLGRAAAVAGLRVALVDAEGREVEAMADTAVRDLGGRRFPAHLDTRRSDEGRRRYEPRRDRPETSFTYRRDRDARDARRRTAGTPSDHHPVLPGDSPRERAAQRRDAAVRARARERERRFLAGEFAGRPDAFTCTCPPGCDELDDRSGPPVHTGDCPCSCDLA
jgi:transcriptional regulator with XRE-family HTH domain